MKSPETAPASESPLSQDVINALRYYLGGRRGLLALGAAAAVGGLVLNWDWLIAVGVAPLLIAALPCVAMCALGLCMSRMAGGNCAPAEEPTRITAKPQVEKSLPAELDSEAVAPLIEPEVMTPAITAQAEKDREKPEDPSDMDGLTEATTERS